MNIVMGYRDENTFHLLRIKNRSLFAYTLVVYIAVGILVLCFAYARKACADSTCHALLH